MEILDFVAPYVSMVEEEDTFGRRIFSLGDLTETLQVKEKDNQLSLVREISNGDSHITTTTTVSDKYLPVASLQVFNHLKASDKWDELWNKCESIKLSNTGCIKFTFGDVYDLPFEVLDMNLIAPKNARQKSQFDESDFSIFSANLSKVKPTYTLTNSFNKSQAFMVVHGFMRLVCTNGLMIPVRLGGEDFGAGQKKKHFKSNQDDIDNMIKESVKRILELDQKVDGIKELHQMQLDKTVIDSIQVLLSDKLENARQRKSYAQYKNPIENTHALIEKLLPRCKNLLDFQNIISYLTGGQPPRFSQATHLTAEEINRTVLKYFE